MGFGPLPARVNVNKPRLSKTVPPIRLKILLGGTFYAWKTFCLLEKNLFFIVILREIFSLSTEKILRIHLITSLTPLESKSRKKQNCMRCVCEWGGGGRGGEITERKLGKITFFLELYPRSFLGLNEGITICLCFLLSRKTLYAYVKPNLKRYVKTQLFTNFCETLSTTYATIGLKNKNKTWANKIFVILPKLLGKIISPAQKM